MGFDAVEVGTHIYDDNYDILLVVCEVPTHLKDYTEVLN